MPDGFRSKLLELKKTKENKTVMITDISGNEHQCYVVSATRTKDWNGPCKPYTHYHYFDVDTLENVSMS